MICAPTLALVSRTQPRPHGRRRFGSSTHASQGVFGGQNCAIHLLQIPLARVQANTFQMRSQGVADLQGMRNHADYPGSDWLCNQGTKEPVTTSRVRCSSMHGSDTILQMGEKQPWFVALDHPSRGLGTHEVHMFFNFIVNVPIVGLDAEAFTSCDCLLLSLLMDVYCRSSKRGLGYELKDRCTGLLASGELEHPPQGFRR